MPDAPNAAIYLTVLPNGMNGNKLCATVLFTISVVDGVDMTPFRNWIENKSETNPFLLDTLIFNFQGTDGSPSVQMTGKFSGPNLLRTYLRQDLWDLLFSTVSPPAASANARGLYAGHIWPIMPDMAYLAAATDQHRLKHATLLSAHVQERRGEKIDAPAYARIKAEIDAEFNGINVYLRPQLSTPGAQVNRIVPPPYSELLAQRNNALKLLPLSAATIPGTTVKSTDLDLINARISAALKTLHEPDEQLLDVAIYAVFRHCVKSALNSTNQTPINALLDNLNTLAMGPQQSATPNKQVKRTTDSFFQTKRTIEFLLSTRREKESASQKVTCDPPPPPQQQTPDFHQMLAFINRYPALLRPLGLAIDVEITGVPPGVGLVGVNVESSFPTPTGVYAGLPKKPTSFETWYNFDPGSKDFSARSRYEHLKAQCGTNPSVDDGQMILWGRYLWLRAIGAHGNLFTIISQDATGNFNKLHNASTDHQRGAEFRTQKPKKDNSLYHDSPDTRPSSRSTGLTLLHLGRLKRTIDALANTPNPSQPPSKTTGTPPFSECSLPEDGPVRVFADDLILGYRPDARRSARDPKADAGWYSLCERDKGLYKTKSTPAWIPTTDAEVAADEGYVTLGSVTQPNSNGDTKLLLQQSLFTWSGWNLSVPPPFDGSTGPSPSQPGDARAIFPIHPEYHLKKGSKLMPLRFGSTYDICCRVVDLAGNSLAANDANHAPPPAVVLTHGMSRQEPVRGPQILLDNPIDRTNCPGETIASLILRDGSSSIERILVPPREPLRLAELTGILPKDNLPAGAFQKVQLEDGGRFPTIAEVFPEEVVTSPDGKPQPESQDGVLRPGFPDRCGYFPDPWANLLCLQFDRADKVALSDCSYDPVAYIPLYSNGRAWPDAPPIRIRLQAGDRLHADTNADVLLFPEKPSGGLTPGCVISLPRASDIKVKVSYAIALPNSTSQPAVSLTQLLAGRSGRQQQSAMPNIEFVTSHFEPYPASAAKPEALKKAVLNVKENDFIDGTNAAQTPSYELRLIHAVKVPLETASFPADFNMIRTSGAANAASVGSITCDVASTGKVTVRAKWTDNLVDDVTLDAPGPRSVNEVAFTLQNSDFDSKGVCTKAKQHIFRDTRAHNVTYAAISTSKFRDFYPEAREHDEQVGKLAAAGKKPLPYDSTFDHPDTPSIAVMVQSSVRPPAPVVAYIVPAFQWIESKQADGSWQTQRQVMIRIYLERPFPITEDAQQLGVLISAGTIGAITSRFVSTIGLDPIIRNTPDVLAGWTKMTMDESMFPSDTKPSPHAAVECYLAECAYPDSTDTGKVKVLPFSVSYAPERRLWYTDILIAPMQGTLDKPVVARSPLIQLALVRYGPNGLPGCNASTDTRISPVVVADFIALNENRWCNVQRKGNLVTLVLSGPSGLYRYGKMVSYKNEGDRKSCLFDTRVTVELQNRWHSVTEDLSWEPVALKPDDVTFASTTPDGQGIDQRTITISLPHASSWFKYAIVLQEDDVFTSDGCATTTFPGNLIPDDAAFSYRLRYFYRFEL